MNLDKLDAAIAYIEAHPEEWDQAYWLARGDGGCGTTACLAGTIVLAEGWQPADWELTDDGFADTVMAKKDGQVRSVDVLAMEILGVPFAPGADNRRFWRVQTLFGGANTLDEIKRIRDKIAAEIAAGEL